MARTADTERRAELLERILDYVSAQGLSDLSLRPLAAAVGSSPRVLLYYFGSKEELIVAVLSRAGERQRDLFAKLPADAGSYASTIRGAWKAMSRPTAEPLFRLFFETYGLALQDRRKYAGFLARVVANWLAYLEAPALRNGYAPDDARALATVILAGFRGFLLDLCATRDRKRIDRAVEMWIAALDAIREPSA